MWLVLVLSVVAQVPSTTLRVYDTVHAVWIVLVLKVVAKYQYTLYVYTYIYVYI